MGPRARARPRRNPRPCFARAAERQSPANTAPIPLCAAPSKWERRAIHHSSNTWPQHAAIVHLNEMNSGRAVAKYLIEDRRFHRFGVSISCCCEKHRAQISEPLHVGTASPRLVALPLRPSCKAHGSTTHISKFTSLPAPRRNPTSCTAPRQNPLRSHACRQRPRFFDFP